MKIVENILFVASHPLLHPNKIELSNVIAKLCEATLSIKSSWIQ